MDKKAQPELIIIGGANGSGKTTFAKELSGAAQLKYLSAEKIANNLKIDGKNSGWLSIARVLINEINTSIRVKESIIIELTLSGKSFIKQINKAKKAGYNVKVVFFYLSNLELCNARIKLRGAQNQIEEQQDTLQRQYLRSNKNFWLIYRHLSHSWLLINNSFSSGRENIAYAVAEHWEKTNVNNISQLHEFLEPFNGLRSLTKFESNNFRINPMLLGYEEIAKYAVSTAIDMQKAMGLVFKT